MRSFITAILLFAVTLLSAQTTQKGYVKTKGRIDNNGQLIPGKRIAGAAIQLTGGHSTVGDANGNFTLTVPDRKFYLSDVRKQGYVLSDPDVLKKQYACSANPLVITMETPERQADDQLAAERKLRRQLQEKLQQREQEIDSLKEHHKISEEEYRQALQQLYAEQENNERLISDMARRYAELDYDLLDEFYRQVSFCLEKGDLVKADSLLASKGDVRQAVLDQQQKAQALQERKKQLRRAEAVFAADNEEVARRCYGYFERFSTQFQNDSAAYYLELRATLDTTNVQWQLDVANFVDAYLAQYRKATSYYERALRQAIAQNGTQHPAVATCYNNIGLLYKVQGQYAQAMEYYQNSLEIWKSVYGENHPDVATTYNNIGGVHYSQGEYPQAMDCFRKALSISRAVCGENHPDVATCYNNIGLTYYSQGDYEQAMSYYRKSLDIQKMVYGENHPDVATSYNNMGVVCYFQQDYDQAKASMATTIPRWPSAITISDWCTISKTTIPTRWSPSRKPWRSSSRCMATTIRRWPPTTTTSAACIRCKRISLRPWSTITRPWLSIGRCMARPIPMWPRAITISAMSVIVRRNTARRWSTSRRH